MLARKSATLSSELDEQGLQAIALTEFTDCLAVPTAEVSICSPFHPGVRELGRCGAHFVGINVHHIPWDYYGRPADQWMEEHWGRFHPVVARLVGAPGSLDAVEQAHAGPQQVVR